MRVVLKFRAQSSLAFRAGRDADRSATLPFISGSVLRAGLADAYRLLYPQQAERFADFFGPGQVSYGNAYPASFDGWRELQGDLATVQPLPLTARSCKRWPGFLFQRTADHDRHGVFDHLIPGLLFALSGETAIAPLEGVATCPKCLASLDRFRGFYRRGDSPAAIGSPEQTTTLLTRVGLSRATGAAQSGILYSRQAMPEGATFWAELAVADAIADEFRDFVEEAGSEGLLRVGTNRTRGLGKLAAECHPLDEPTDPEENLRARLAEWKQALDQAADEAMVDLAPGWYVPLTLTSDALLLDPLLRWQLRLDSRGLAESGVVGASLVYQMAGTRRVTGWNGLVGLPRDDAFAMAMGSVFVVRFDAESDVAALLRLEVEGIGERREEGFGRLVVADRFHWEVQNQ